MKAKSVLIYISLGCRQGDPISSSLFYMCRNYWYYDKAKETYQRNTNTKEFCLF